MVGLRVSDGRGGGGRLDSGVLTPKMKELTRV